jgi:hypothetical protein
VRSTPKTRSAKSSACSLRQAVQRVASAEQIPWNLWVSPKG